jgi:hypothetical protein
MSALRTDRLSRGRAEAAVRQLVVHHRQAGIEALLIDRCDELAGGRTFSGGILALSVQGINAAICLIDYCSEHVG